MYVRSSCIVRTGQGRCRVQMGSSGSKVQLKALAMEGSVIGRKMLDVQSILKTHIMKSKRVIRIIVFYDSFYEYYEYRVLIELSQKYNIIVVF